jgi:hypothetical protein
LQLVTEPPPIDIVPAKSLPMTLPDGEVPQFETDGEPVFVIMCSPNMIDSLTEYFSVGLGESIPTSLENERTEKQQTISHDKNKDDLKFND